jgi:hypothetical protein
MLNARAAATLSGGTGEVYTVGGPNPRLLYNLLGWLLQELMGPRVAKEWRCCRILLGSCRLKPRSWLSGLSFCEREVGPRTDDEMILMLVSENGTQNNNKAAATLDSVAAVTGRLAYESVRYFV